MIGAEDFHAIVLAAGAGSRFGGPKLAATWNGGPLLNAALRSARAAPVTSVLVVTGEHADIVEDVVSAFAQLPGKPIKAVRCEEHAQGMSASLRSGLAALPTKCAGAFVFLGDMPCIPDGVPLKLLELVLAGAWAAVPAVEGRFGHPVLISRRLFGSFSCLSGDRGGRDALLELRERMAVLDVDDPGIFSDIDTSADLERF